MGTHVTGTSSFSIRATVSSWVTRQTSLVCESVRSASPNDACRHRSIFRPPDRRRDVRAVCPSWRCRAAAGWRPLHLVDACSDVEEREKLPADDVDDCQQRTSSRTHDRRFLLPRHHPLTLNSSRVAHSVHRNHCRSCWSRARCRRRSRDVDPSAADADDLHRVPADVRRAVCRRSERRYSDTGCRRDPTHTVSDSKRWTTEKRRSIYSEDLRTYTWRSQWAAATWKTSPSTVIDTAAVHTSCVFLPCIWEWDWIYLKRLFLVQLRQLRLLWTVLYLKQSTVWRAKRRLNESTSATERQR